MYHQYDIELRILQEHYLHPTIIFHLQGINNDFQLDHQPSHLALIIQSKVFVN